jgi:6-phosphogluconate dehydrogenase (decarboxylating)
MQIGMSGLGRTVATMVHRFVKVIHDGIDYCIMCAFAEGSNARQNIDAGKRK